MITLRKELERRDCEILPLYVALDQTEETIDVKVAECDKYELKVLNAVSLLKNVNSVSHYSNLFEQSGLRQTSEESLSLNF